MARLTVKAINKAVAHTGLTLVKAERHFYWTGKGSEYVETSVLLASVNQWTLERWIHDAEAVARNIANTMRDIATNDYYRENGLWE